MMHRSYPQAFKCFLFLPLRHLRPCPPFLRLILASWFAKFGMHLASLFFKGTKNMLFVHTLKFFQGDLALGFIKNFPCVDVKGRWILDDACLLQELFRGVSIVLEYRSTLKTYLKFDSKSWSKRMYLGSLHPLSEKFSCAAWQQISVECFDRWW